MAADTIAAPMPTIPHLTRASRWCVGRGRWVTAYVAVALTGLWSSRSFWWPGRYVVGFDGYAYSGPNLQVTEAATRRWSLALWNDAIFGGVTHLGNPQAGTLYPPRLLAVVLDTNRAMGVLVALHVVLLGAGIVTLARRLELGAGAATVGGCATVLGGMTLTKAVQFEQILVIAWMPWLLAAILAVLRGRRPWPAVAGLAIVTAATLSAGHPQMTFEAIVLAFAVVVGAVAERRRLGHLAAGAALGALIAAPQVIAAAIATAQSAITAGRDPAQLLDRTYSTVPDAVVRNLLGDIVAGDPIAFVGAFEGISFVGVVLMSLAVIGTVDGLTRRGQRRWTAALAAVAVIAVIWSAGPRTIIFRATRRLIPGFELARVSSRWLIVVAIVVVVLAMSGLDALLRRRLTRRTAVISAVLVGAGGLVVVAMRVADASVVVRWVVIALLALAAVAIAVEAHGAARRVGAGVLAVTVIVELGLMSLHSVPQGAAVGTPFDSASYRSNDDGLAPRPGRLHDLAHRRRAGARLHAPRPATERQRPRRRALGRRLRRRRPDHRAVGRRAAPPRPEPQPGPPAAQRRAPTARPGRARPPRRALRADRPPPPRRRARPGLGRARRDGRPVRRLREPGLAGGGRRLAGSPARAGGRDGRRGCARRRWRSPTPCSWRHPTTPSPAAPPAHPSDSPSCATPPNTPPSPSIWRHRRSSRSTSRPTPDGG